MPHPLFQLRALGGQLGRRDAIVELGVEFGDPARGAKECPRPALYIAKQGNALHAVENNSVAAINFNYPVRCGRRQPRAMDGARDGVFTLDGLHRSAVQIQFDHTTTAPAKNLRGEALGDKNLALELPRGWFKGAHCLIILYDIGTTSTGFRESMEEYAQPTQGRTRGP